MVYAKPVPTVPRYFLNEGLLGPNQILTLNKPQRAAVRISTDTKDPAILTKTRLLFCVQSPCPSTQCCTRKTAPAASVKARVGEPRSIGLKNCNTWATKRAAVWLSSRFHTCQNRNETSKGYQIGRGPYT